MAAIVQSTAEASYATDASRRIVAFNGAARRLLGYRRSDVLGHLCFEVLRGTDRFGNRFCDHSCPLFNMARRREPIRDFDIRVRDSAGHVIEATVAAMVLHGGPPSERFIVHHLKPIDSKGREGKPSRRPPASPSEPPPPLHLTPREIEVLQLLAAGKSTEEAARSLAVSRATVRNHVKATLTKLGVHSRIAALASAQRNHLI